ncbi:hypothetical protein V9K67_22300 [Paraflavisolibacter sp. H34]|uniref:hypothetical protein n=1 Tax=Huijunlia imazamoxiresistens TaxID=3127457 RepID=UPI003019E8AE
MNKKNLPLSLLKDTDQLLKEFQKLTFENEDIIHKIDDDKSLLLFRDKEHPSFYFQVTTPNQTSDHRSFFHFQFVPHNEHSIERNATFNNALPEVVKNFNYWISLLRQYNEINLSEEDFITQQYEEELFHEFEIVDDDAYIKPFEHEKQIFLYKLLTYVESELKKEDNRDVKIQELICETQDLKENIQNLTKKNVIRKLSKIFAKVKKHGIKLFQEVLNEAKKELIKKALSGGIDEISSLMHHTF